MSSAPDLPAGPDSVPVPSVCLVVLDGWGLADDGPGNAVSLADTPTFDSLWERYPHTTLSTSGPDVGLPEGQMGNSEVGHLNLGAGAIVKQDLARIDTAIADGTFFENPVLLAACQQALEARGRLHLIGLLSDGGVHSGWEHIEAMIELAADRGVPDLVLHAMTDGRDTLPSSGAGYVEEAERWLRRAGRFGTVGGRYWGMDRDRRWERTQRAYDSIIHAEGEHAPDAAAAVEAGYQRGETDEFIAPTVIGDYDGAAEGDPVVFFNFRPDRARQLTEALSEPDFEGFPRKSAPLLPVTTMTSYRDEWSHPVAFPPERPEVTLASVISDAGGKQLHAAETEKYAHVTYFFNGGKESEWEGEERTLVDSPRDVATYDERPEMSAAGAAEHFTDRWRSEEFKFGVINFANPDMVGHTGVIPAAVTAIEEVDQRLAEVVEAVHLGGGACLITADHGNAEQMLEPDGSPNTAHSVNPVPFICTVEGISLGDGGILADVAPTVLDLLGVPQPEQMTGRSLIDHAPRGD